MEFALFSLGHVPHHLTDADPDAEHHRLMDEIHVVQEADRLGFKYAWVSEHHFLHEYSHLSDSGPFLGYLAATTERIHIGSGIFHVTPRVNHPARIAERVAMLDHLSGGRFEFGTGRGSSSVEHGGFGIEDSNETRAMYDEVMPQFAAMWRRDEYSFAGRYFSMPPRRIVPRPWKKPHPPMWVAAANPATFEKAARMGLGVLCFTSGSPRELAPLIETYKKHIVHAEPVGDFVNDNVTCVSTLVCREDASEAVEMVTRNGQMYHQSLAFRYLDTFPKGPDVPVWPQLVPELGAEQVRAAVADGAMCVGDPDVVRTVVRGFADMGCDQLGFALLAGRLPTDVATASLQLFAKEVLREFDTDPVHRSDRMRSAAVAPR